jgi:hypothetical protein
MEYTLPSIGQILFGWDVKPTAKVIALVIRDYASDQMDDNEAASKVTISKDKLGSISNASADGVDAALKELRDNGFLEETPGKSKNAPHSYRLHVGNNKHYKTKADWNFKKNSQ